MEKVVRDGEVAVLCSYGYGGGWSTWNHVNRELKEKLIFCPQLVEKNEKEEKITEEFCYELFGKDIYLGGLKNLTIEWIPINTVFKIIEHDGNESIEIIYR